MAITEIDPHFDNQKRIDILPFWKTGIEKSISSKFFQGISRHIHAQKRIRELETDNERLLFENQHDDLTKLYNRKAFLSKANEALANASPGESHVVLFIDLDNFKAINEKTAGRHAEGDRALIAVAERLAAVTRDDDMLSYFPGRLGGDEFVAFANTTPRHPTGARMSDQERAEAFGNRIEQEINKLISGEADWEALGVGASVSTVTRLPGETAEAMIARGDQMQEAIKAEHHAVLGQHRIV